MLPAPSTIRGKPGHHQHLKETTMVAHQLTFDFYDTCFRVTLYGHRPDALVAEGTRLTIAGKPRIVSKVGGVVFDNPSEWHPTLREAFRAAAAELREDFDRGVNALRAACLEETGDPLDAC